MEYAEVDRTPPQRQREERPGRGAFHDRVGEDRPSPHVRGGAHVRDERRAAGRGRLHADPFAEAELEVVGETGDGIAGPQSLACGASGLQRDGCAVDVEPTQARPADLLGQAAVVVRSLEDRQQRPGDRTVLFPTVPLILRGTLAGGCSWCAPDPDDARRRRGHSIGFAPCSLPRPSASQYAHIT